MGLREHVPEELVVIVVLPVCVAVVGVLDLLTTVGVFEVLGHLVGPAATEAWGRHLLASALTYLAFGGLLAIVVVALLGWMLVSTARSVVAAREG
jgi:hypothetical protein